MDRNEFVTACREGGPAMDRALRRIDRAFFAVLYRECRAVIRDAELARDLVQDTFIKVWQRCATFNGISDLLPWIRAVMRNTMIDRLRRSVPEVAIDDVDSAIIDKRFEELAANSPTPHNEARAAESAACFERCWERFAHDCPDHAAVIAWIAQDGLDNEDIAALLERSPGATREYIRQCRKRARQYLAEWHELAFRA